MEISLDLASSARIIHVILSHSLSHFGDLGTELCAGELCTFLRRRQIRLSPAFIGIRVIVMRSYLISGFTQR